MAEAPLLTVEGLRKWFPVREGLLQRTIGHIHAVEDVSFTLDRGEVLALVGESGSGKTTTGRLLLRLIEPTQGDVRFDGTDLMALGRNDMRRFRRRMQIIFQDPFSSLNPYMRVGAVIDEALRIHGLVGGAKERHQRVGELLALVGLRQAHADRFPHEFSGGQRQRIGIARALAVEPDFIVADEPVSALDVSIQAQIVNLLRDLQEQLGLAMLFIAHDLAVVQRVADRVAVMYLGRIVEIATTEQLFAGPHHPYTMALLSAAPVPDPEIKRARIILQGDMPSPEDPPSGCVFRTRCPFALSACAEAVPPLRDVAPGQRSACIRDDVQPRSSTRVA